jgi:hypothetical protein
MPSYPGDLAANGFNTQRKITKTAHGFTATAAGCEAPLLVSSVLDANNFNAVSEGYVTGLTGLVAGETYFLSTAAGAITITAPTTGFSRAVFRADSTTSGYVIQQSTIALSGGGGGGISTTPLIRVVTTSQIYTPTAGMKTILAKMVGAGQGGGGAPASTATTSGFGTCGVNGAYLEFTATAAQVGASQSLTIGVGSNGGTGVGTVANLASAGGDTVFGTLATCKGGNGGFARNQSAASVSVSQLISTGVTATVTTGNLIFSIINPSFSGGTVLNSANGLVFFGSPMENPFSSKVPDFFGLFPIEATLVGFPAAGIGQGGMGTLSAGSAFAAKTGQKGGDGLIVITEYF